MNGGWYSVKDVNWKNVRGDVSDKDLFKQDLAKLAELFSDKNDGKVSAREAKAIISKIETASKVGQVDGHLRPTEALKGINELLLTATGETKVQLQKAKSSLLAELGSVMDKYDLASVRSAAGDLTQADFEKRFDQVIPLEKAITNIYVSQKPLDLMIARKGGDVSVFYRNSGSTDEWKIMENGITYTKDGSDVEISIRGNLTYQPDKTLLQTSVAGDLKIMCGADYKELEGGVGDEYSDEIDPSTWNIRYIGSEISAKNPMVGQHMEAARKIMDEDCIYYKKPQEGTVGALLNGKVDVNGDGLIDRAYINDYDAENRYLQVEYNYKGKPTYSTVGFEILFHDSTVDLSSISDANEQAALQKVCTPNYSKYDFYAERHWVHVLKQQDIDDNSYTSRVLGSGEDAKAIGAQCAHSLGMDDCFKHLKTVVEKRGSPLKELTLNTHGVDDEEQERIVQKLIDDGIIAKDSKLIFASCSNAEGCRKFETCKLIARKYGIHLYASRVTEYTGDSVYTTHYNPKLPRVEKISDYDSEQKYYDIHFPKYIDLWYFSPVGYEMQMNYPHGYTSPKK